MTATAQNQAATLQRRTGVTAAEYSAMPEDAPRCQLVEGELIDMSPAPSTRHQRVTGRLHARLYLALEKSGAGEAFVAPIDVHLSDRSVLQPDVVVVLAKSLARVEEDGIHGPPDLVVEVLSPGTRRLDLGRKDRLFAAHGVREAWFVDLELDEVRIHRYEGNVTAAPVILSRTATLETPLLPGLRLAVADAVGA